MLADRDIICISGVAWDSYWISLHQNMSRLARTHRVLFVNRPVALPSAIARGTRKAEDRAIARGGVRRVDERLYVADPPAALPLRFERPVTVVNQAVRSWFIARVARRLGFGRPLLWMHDIDAARIVKRVDPWVSLYWVTDDHPTGPAFRANPTNRLPGHACSIARASPLGRSGTDDRTSTPRCESERQLEQPLRAARGRCRNDFARAASPQTRPAPPFGPIPGPIVGFVGQINERLDRELITVVARAHPEWSIVFVGPILRDLDVGREPSRTSTFSARRAWIVSRVLESLMETRTVHVNEHTRTMNPLRSSSTWPPESRLSPRRSRRCAHTGRTSPLRAAPRRSRWPSSRRLSKTAMGDGAYESSLPVGIPGKPVSRKSGDSSK